MSFENGIFVPDPGGNNSLATSDATHVRRQEGGQEYSRRQHNHGDSGSNRERERGYGYRNQQQNNYRSPRNPNERNRLKTPNRSHREGPGDGSSSDRRTDEMQRQKVSLDSASSGMVSSLNPEAAAFQPRNYNVRNSETPKQHTQGEGATGGSRSYDNRVRSPAKSQIRSGRGNRERNHFPNSDSPSSAQPYQSNSSSSAYSNNGYRNRRDGHFDQWVGENAGSRDRSYPSYEVDQFNPKSVTEEPAKPAVDEKPFEFKIKSASFYKKPEPRNQRETLTDQLCRSVYDCMICVEKVKRHQPIWACQKCFNVFHLNCVTKWASSSADEIGWRCPGCQTYNDQVPFEYRCFCGAVKNPAGMHVDVPHTCGQTCNRKGVGGVDCLHCCTIQCHPGPCPPCEAIQTRHCSCGKTTAQVICSSKVVITCGKTCDKLLNCLVHTCTRLCHAGSCDICEVTIVLKCHCKGTVQEVICTEETGRSTVYSCGSACNKPLNCTKHFCEETCHPGMCKPCKMSPEAMLSCPCGQTSIAQACSNCRLPLRTSCSDPIPTCGKVCKKILPCGEPGQNHNCLSKCHIDSKCPVCPLVTSIKCRCGNKNFDIPCKEYSSSSEKKCEKKCTKKRSCGKHKCNTKCCIDPDHICPIVCDRQLRCGNHNCSLLCHNGHCPACRVVSFDELHCECGSTVIYPPVPCGTKRPPCSQVCSRNHECDHPVLHQCHSEPECPPCTVLTQQWCSGNHELRKNVMCHIKQISCGMPCQKLLDCGRHKCIKACHAGACFLPGESCNLPCEVKRVDCGHSCGDPCHDPPCVESKCKRTTEVSCGCGRKKEAMVCWKREKEYDRHVTYLFNVELKKLRAEKKDDNPEINEKDLMDVIKENSPKPNILDCDKECQRIERNRKMVEALQLEDPDVTSTFGTPKYSEFLMKFAKKDPKFVESVHTRLTELVMVARKSKRKNETFAFDSMNRDKRHVVHEYSDHFGCLSESFDEEPNRNVICTASKEKSYLPAVSLVDAVFRPSNIRTERKNAYEDVEVYQTSRSKIMRPSNGKILLPAARSGSGMVPLNGPYQLPNGDYPPLK